MADFDQHSLLTESTPLNTTLDSTMPDTTTETLSPARNEAEIEAQSSNQSHDQFAEHSQDQIQLDDQIDGPLSDAGEHHGGRPGVKQVRLRSNNPSNAFSAAKVLETGVKLRDRKPLKLLDLPVDCLQDIVNHVRQSLPVL